jgi:hypothetical protein
MIKINARMLADRDFDVIGNSSSRLEIWVVRWLDDTLLRRQTPYLNRVSGGDFALFAVEDKNRRFIWVKIRQTHGVKQA